MKNILHYFLIAAIICVTASCSRERFADINTNPDAILNIPPEYELSTALINMHNGTFEQYYDYNLGIYYWTQTFVIGTGNNEGSYQAQGNIGQRWSRFYNAVGNRLIDIKEIIKKLPEDRKAAYTYLNAIVDIPLAYYAWYTTDVYGSIPYTEAFKARYTTPPLLTPKYDKQDELYDILDTQLKNAIAVLKSPPNGTQANLTGYDQFYNGDPVKWIKVANSLRLKIAMRLMKRNPEKLRTIANEVLSDNVGLITNIAEGWRFVGGTQGFTGNDNNPSNQRPVSGSKSMVDFMWNTQDPRMRVFFLPSHFTKERFDSAQAQGRIPASFVWDGQLYRGQFVSPDAALVSANAPYFSLISYRFNGAPVNNASLVSPIQPGLFNPTPNTGLVTFPMITCSDVFFMRAELAQRNIVGSIAEAQSWYYRAIDSSLVEYDQMATRAKLPNYTVLSPAEIAAYKTKAGVVYNAANALEQICVQQFINYYKNNSEAWAVIKRTGFPSVNGNIMKAEIFTNSGNVLPMPRRFSIDRALPTNINAQNINDAIADMEKNVEGFGTPNDITGRVWWDKP